MDNEGPTVQQRDSDIRIHVSILPQTPLPSRLPHNIEQSSLCDTVGPCWLSILNAAVCTRPYQTPKLSLSPTLLGNHKFVLQSLRVSFSFVSSFVKWYILKRCPNWLSILRVVHLVYLVLMFCSRWHWLCPLSCPPVLRMWLNFIASLNVCLSF